MAGGALGDSADSGVIGDEEWGGRVQHRAVFSRPLVHVITIGSS